MKGVDRHAMSRDHPEAKMSEIMRWGNSGSTSTNRIPLEVRSCRHSGVFDMATITEHRYNLPRLRIGSQIILKLFPSDFTTL
jgi:hypothetical protein